MASPRARSGLPAPVPRRSGPSLCRSNSSLGAAAVTFAPSARSARPNRGRSAPGCRSAAPRCPGGPGRATVRPGRGRRPASGADDRRTLPPPDPEHDSLGGDDGLERVALLAWEHRGADRLRALHNARDDAAARSTERLAGRHAWACGTGLGCRPTVSSPAKCTMSTMTRGPDRGGDLAELRGAQLARVGRPACVDHPRSPLVGQPPDLVHVDAGVFGPYAVGRHVVEPAGEVQPHAVREVAAVGSRNRMVLLGVSSAAITAALACAPACGWTLAAVAPNSTVTRSIASCSMTSTCSKAAVGAAAR